MVSGSLFFFCLIFFIVLPIIHGVSGSRVDTTAVKKTPDNISKTPNRAIP